jgi:catechol 2,3-dioxygenase-like lactoylglutathione lyase family enzyme
MLANSPLIAFIPTKDAARARAFYEGKLGQRFISDDNFAVVMDANGTMLRIARVGDFTPMPFTILGWEVEDIDAAVAALAAKGVTFSRYSFLEQSDIGVWTAPGGVAKVAWFLDPDGNTLSLSQHAPS